jgi:hypothetical protein
MARDSRKLGRPKGDRVTPHAAFVRYSDAEKELIERAIAKQSRGLIGAKATIPSFFREAGVILAKKVLED